MFSNKKTRRVIVAALSFYFAGASPANTQTPQNKNETSGFVISGAGGAAGVVLSWLGFKNKFGWRDKRVFGGQGTSETVVKVLDTYHNTVILDPKAVENLKSNLAAKFGELSQKNVKVVRASAAYIKPKSLSSPKIAVAIKKFPNLRFGGRDRSVPSAGPIVDRFVRGWKNPPKIQGSTQDHYGAVFSLKWREMLVKKTPKAFNKIAKWTGAALVVGGIATAVVLALKYKRDRTPENAKKD